MEKFSDRLKELRLLKGYTQSEVAEYIGVKQNSYNSWENGKREPKFSTVVVLARLFNTSVDYLLGETNDNRSSQRLLELLEETNNKVDNIFNKSNSDDLLPLNLRRLRENKGLTREELETFLPSRGDYFKWELGISEPNLENTVALSNYFQVSVDSLYNYTLYKGGEYNEINTLSDVFVVKIDNEISKFEDYILDLVYEFGYKYTDVEISKEDLVSGLDYLSMELNLMKQQLDNNLSPVTDNMVITYEREEKNLKKNIIELKKKMKEEPYSYFLEEQLKNAEEMMEDRNRRVKKLIELNKLKNKNE